MLRLIERFEAENDVKFLTEIVTCAISTDGSLLLIPF